MFVDCVRNAGMYPDNGVRKMLTEDSRAPSIYPLAKDHKPTFPDTKIRAVQPICSSAIEKLDILVSRVLTQPIPMLTHRVVSTEA